MDNILHFFRDPLFGVAILIAIIAFIALATYFWNIHAKKRQQDSIEHFMKLFDNMSIDEVAQETLLKLGESLPALQFLAETYSRMGNYERSMKLYVAILECDLDYASRLKNLQSLGEVYFCAGFLERAKKILLEVLKNQPRNPQALCLLMRTYESLELYDEACDALGCLEELGLEAKKIQLNRAYFFLKKSFMQIDEQSLLQLLQHNAALLSYALDKLKIHNLSLFWKIFKQCNQGEEILDILWNIKKDELLKNMYECPLIEDICAAKGYIKLSRNCTVFELEALSCLQKAGIFGDLEFIYCCKECKESYPLRFERCLGCGELLSVELTFIVRKAKNETCQPLL